MLYEAREKRIIAEEPHLPESWCKITRNTHITRNDALGYGLPIYHIGRRIKEVTEEFPDETYIIYVNAKIRDETTELGRLMHDLQCRNAEEMYSEILAGRVRELKETPEGVDSMCREMDEIYNEGIEIGIERGLKQGMTQGLEKGKMEMKQLNCFIYG